MRVFLNNILAFIGSESLTDAEFGTINLTEQNYSLNTYNALKSVLEGREMVSNQLWKLKSYFRIKGAPVSGENAVTPVSNIFLGASLGQA